jgi:hypothetical protein
MTKHTQAHLKAFMSHFELACEFGILICLTDIVWLFHDITANGLSLTYSLIFLGLVTGLLGTVYVLYKHHKAYTHRLASRINKIQESLERKANRWV